MVQMIGESPLKKRLKILIGVPTYTGKIVVETTACWLGLLRYHTLRYPMHSINFQFQTRQFTTYAAERLSESALKEYDYLLFWGDDIVAPHDSLEKLLFHDKEMIAARVFQRCAPFAFYAYDDNMKHFSLNRVNTGLQRAKAAGTGLMLIKSSVFDGLSKLWWEWPNDDETDCDTEFCLKVKKEKNIDTWVDTDLGVDHLDFTPNPANEKTHEMWLNQVKASGILDNEQIKNHKDFHRLEDLVDG